MTEGQIYLLDTSVLVEAYRRYYAFDIAPRFWEQLINNANNGRIISIDRVRDELVRGKDDLAKWAKDEFTEAFASTNDDDVIKSFADIITWSQNQSQYTDAAKAEFANGADGWLVAYAKVKNVVVVTQEVHAPDSKTDIKIPTACHACKVKPIDTFEMMRKLGISF
ncbi:MAG TPA: DUF4411 family protein [bacterium]